MKRLLIWFMRRRENEELKNEVIDYLSESAQRKVETGEKPPEYLEERQEELMQRIDELREDIAERFLIRSRVYVILTSLVIVFSYLFTIYSSFLSPNQIGALISLTGSIILGYALIQGPYRLFGILAASGWGAPRLYFKRSLINDTVDGIWGVSYLIVGFSIQVLFRYF